MIHRILCVLTCWTMASGLCHGQATFELTPHWNADRNDNLFEDGEINDWDEKNHPVGWDEISAFESGVALKKGNSAGFVLACPADGSEAYVATTIDLPDDTKYVTLLARMRGKNRILGKSKDAGAGMVYTLENDDGRKLKLPKVVMDPEHASVGGWKSYRSTVAVFPGYTKLNIRASIVDAEGLFELDSVLVMSSKPDFQAPEKMQQLRSAIVKDDAEAVKELIEETPELLNLRDGIGPWGNPTPLIIAATYNAKNVAKELVRMGADLEASDDSWDRTPLGVCSNSGRPEIAKTLIDAGAKTSSGGVKTREYARIATAAKHRYTDARVRDYDKILEYLRAAQANPTTAGTNE